MEWMLLWLAWKVLKVMLAIIVVVVIVLWLAGNIKRADEYKEMLISWLSGWMKGHDGSNDE